MKVGIIGTGAIGRFVMTELRAAGHEIAAVLVCPTRAEALSKEFPTVVGRIEDLPGDLDIIADCAGHGALRQYGTAILSRGIDLVSVSVGALADDDFAASLEDAAASGGGLLHLASGAIGALDALRAARIGSLSEVRYIGRKPPSGWIGSPAEDVIDLTAPLLEPVTHFQGSARDAAIAYPKNANVAAAVAMAGVGFDTTAVTLVADPSVTANIHEIEAIGDFGSFSFRIEGRALPGNPRSSALAAMSVVATIEALSSSVRL